LLRRLGQPLLFTLPGCDAFGSSFRRYLCEMNSMDERIRHTVIVSVSVASISQETMPENAINACCIKRTLSSSLLFIASSSTINKEIMFYMKREIIVIIRLLKSSCLARKNDYALVSNLRLRFIYYYLSFNLLNLVLHNKNNILT